MMSGKAVSRALCGHFLLEAALTNKLLLKVWPSNENEIGTDVEYINTAVHKFEATDTEKISHYDGIQSKVLSIDAVGESEELCKFEQCLLEYKALLCEKLPTAKLWLRYLEYVSTLKLFIRAEQTGN